MQSRPDLMGTDEMRGRQKRSYIGFEKLEEEYNYEMSMNNAAGRTSVFENNRTLFPEKLELNI